MIKKLIYLIAILFLIVPNAMAFMGPAVAGGGMPPAIVGGDCPEGTYLAYWDGLHGSGEEYICLANGGSSANSTAHDADHIDAGVFTITAADQYVSWQGLSMDYPSYTICVEVQVNDNVTVDHSFFEIYETYSGSDNYAYLRIEDNTRLTSALRAGGSSDNINDADVVTSKGLATETFCFSWREDPTSTYADDVANRKITSGGSTAWNDAEQSDDPLAMTAALTEINMGDLRIGQGQSQTIKILRWVVMSGWEEDCLWSY